MTKAKHRSVCRGGGELSLLRFFLERFFTMTKGLFESARFGAFLLISGRLLIGPRFAPSQRRDTSF